MIKFVGALLGFLLCGAALARERPILSCDRAPLLAEMQANLPDHVMGMTADVRPKLITKMTRTNVPLVSIFRRANATLVCIVVAIDSTGKAQDAAISYPRMALTEAEREKFLELEYSPAQQGGRHVPSFVSFEIKLN